MRIMQELPGLSGEKPVHRIGGKDLCDLWGVTPAVLTHLVQKGVAVRLGHDAYDLAASTRAYLGQLRAAAAGRGSEEQALTLTGERARLAREQADAQALKNAERRGELVAAAEVERAWADVLRGLRSQLLALPGRLRMERPELTPADAEALDRELRDTLARIGAEGLPQEVSTDG